MGINIRQLGTIIAILLLTSKGAAITIVSDGTTLTGFVDNLVLIDAPGIITGKGKMGAETERGVLRRMVPHWLRLPDLRPLVVGFEEAEQRHGGAGALGLAVQPALFVVVQADDGAELDRTPFRPDR